MVEVRRVMAAPYGGVVTPPCHARPMAVSTTDSSTNPAPKPGKRGTTSGKPGTNPGPVMRTRPLCRDYGGDARSQELAASIEAHQRAISVHEGALLRDIAEFDRTEAWRGDGALSMRSWLIARCHVGGGRSRVLVDTAQKVDELPLLCAALCAGSLTLDVLSPIAAVCPKEADEEVAAQA